MDICSRDVTVQGVLHGVFRAVLAQCFPDRNLVSCAQDSLPGAELVLPEHFRHLFPVFIPGGSQDLRQQLRCLFSIFLQCAGIGCQVRGTGFILSAFRPRNNGKAQGARPAFDILLQRKRVVTGCGKPSQESRQLGQPGQFFQAIVCQGEIEPDMNHTVAVQPVCHHFYPVTDTDAGFCPYRLRVRVFLVQPGQRLQCFRAVRGILPCCQRFDQPVVFSFFFIPPPGHKLVQAFLFQPALLFTDCSGRQRMQRDHVFPIQQHIRCQFVEPSAVQPCLQFLYHPCRFQRVCGIAAENPVADAADAPADSLGFVLFPQRVNRAVQGSFHRASVQAFPPDLLTGFLQQVQYFVFFAVRYVFGMNGQPALQGRIIHGNRKILRQSPLQRSPLQQGLIAARQHVAQDPPCHVFGTVLPGARNPSEGQMAAVFFLFFLPQFILDGLLGSHRLLIAVFRYILPAVKPVQVGGNQGQHLLHRRRAVQVDPCVGGMVMTPVLFTETFVGQ